MEGTTEQVLFPTITDNGCLELTKDGKFKFHGQHINIEGQFAPSVPKDICVPATARFRGITGPYNLQGAVGDKGIEFKFAGAPGIGNGTISAGAVAISPIEFKGAANVTITPA